MNFFTQLAALGQGMDVNLRIKGKNGRLTVAVEPQMANVSRLTPLVVTGTPEELDEGFIAQFDGAISAVKGLESNLADVKKDATDFATKAPAKKDSTTQAKPAPKAAPKKDQPAKHAHKKKEDKPVPAPGDMFSQSAEDPAPDETNDTAEEPAAAGDETGNETE